MRTMVMGVVAVLLASGAMSGCGGAYDTQCDGPDGIDCGLVDLPICTTKYGNRAPHAFCTRECASDDDCGTGGACSTWRFERGEHRVCVSPFWLRSG